MSDGLFTDTEPSGPEVPSSWNKVVRTVEKECQTDKFKGVHRRLQTIPIAIMEYKARGLPDIKKGDYLPYVDGGTQTEDVIPAADAKVTGEVTPEVESFLSRVSGVMLSELGVAIDSRAFDEYTVSWSDDRDSLTKLYSLREPNGLTAPAASASASAASSADSKSSKSDSKSSKDSKSKSAASGKSNASTAAVPAVAGHTHVSDAKYMNSCSAVGFNSTGTVIGVGLGRSDHDGWCMHRSTIAFFATNRLKPIAQQQQQQTASAAAAAAGGGAADPKSPTNAGRAAAAAAAPALGAVLSGSKPDLEIETSCCVTCVSFHPEQPTIVSVGLFSGEIVVYDIGRKPGDADDDTNPVRNGADDDDDDDDAAVSKKRSTAAGDDTGTSTDSKTKTGSMLLATSGEPASVLSTTIDDYFHREPIGKLVWVRDVQKDRLQWQLVSVSGDGRVLFWSPDLNRLAYPVYGCAIAPSPKYYGQPPATTAGQAPSSKRNTFPILGATAIAFSPIDFSNFVVGTESGGVLKGLQPTRTIRRGFVKFNAYTYTADAHYMIETSADKTDLRRTIEKYAFTLGGSGGSASTTTGSAASKSASAAAADKSDLKLDISHIFNARPNPKSLYAQCSKFAFESHSGPVYALAFSPFHRHLFLSCSTDGTVQLRHLLQIKPVLTFHPSSAYLFDVVWSPVRPLVFAIGDGNGALHIYDLLESTLAPVRTEQFTNSNDAAAAGGGDALVSLCFSPRDPTLLAAADQSGRAYVWQLSARLSQLQSEELAALNRLARVGQGEDAE